MNSRTWRIALLLLLACVVAIAADNPVADEKAVVVSGQARFTVLTPQLIRMEWSEKGMFEDHASLVFINRRLPVPQFRSSTLDGWLTIDTGQLLLRYRVGSGRLALSGESKRWPTWRTLNRTDRLRRLPVFSQLAR